MRLDKYLADAGVGTRSEVKAIIKKGLVTINEQIIKDAGKAVTEQDVVCYQNEQVKKQELRYFMMNKPAGCVCATRDETQTVLDYMKDENVKDLFPVGRLDKDTEGLLLITDDGMFAHNLTSPRKHVDKTYYFEGNGILADDSAKQVAEGIDIGDDKVTKPAVLEVLTVSAEEQRVTGKLTICEGRYHQVKRMLAKLGVTITYLKRLSIGNVMLDPLLAEGTYRRLTEEEIYLLSEGRSN